MPSGVVLALSGELDLASAPGARSRAPATPAGTHPGRLLVDLRGLEFIDSVRAGIDHSGSAIGQWDDRARAPVSGGARRQVQRLFELVGLGRPLRLRGLAPRPPAAARLRNDSTVCSRLAGRIGCDRLPALFDRLAGGNDRATAPRTIDGGRRMHRLGWRVLVAAIAAGLMALGSVGSRQRVP